MENTTQQSSETALNIFAILGFIALLFAGLWSTIQIVKHGSGFFSTVSSRAFQPFNGLTDANDFRLITTTADTVTGKPFELSWNTPEIAGDLTMSYPCREEFFFKVSVDADTNYAIPCNAPFTLPKGSASIILIPISPAGFDNQLPVSFTFTGEDKSIEKDSAIVSVVGTDPMVATNTVTYPVNIKGDGAPSSEEAPVIPVTDLSVEIVRVGTSSQGVFAQTTSFAQNDKVSVQFRVTNSSTHTLSNWTFSANIPTNPPYVFTSEIQPTLESGAQALLTMTFDSLAVGTGTVVITVDGIQAIKEVSENNNADSVTITVQ
jgi:hypothetical protein